MTTERSPIKRSTTLWGFPLVVLSAVAFYTYNNLMNLKPSHLSLCTQLSYSPEAATITANGQSSSLSSFQAFDKERRLLKYFQTYHYVQAPKDRLLRPLPSKICGGAPDFDEYFEQDFMSRSRFHEDKAIYNLFFKDQIMNDTQTGTYIELGAFDGMRESNTRFFEECLGWKGLLLEGNPERYMALIGNRPFSHRMNVAPSCSAEYERVNGTISFHAFPWTNAGLQGVTSAYVNKTTIEVPCGPLGPILADVFEGHESINFFSLDVELAEKMVLETIDFSSIPRIDILMIESANTMCPEGKCQSTQDVRTLMHAAGYLRYEGVIRDSDL
ncbi:MAG: hypothetical protein SGILL_007204, partial [Bacillariaceae sp.]